MEDTGPDENPLIPPLNFAMVAKGWIFLLTSRSISKWVSQQEKFSLSQKVRLEINSVGDDSNISRYLCPEDYTNANMEFLKANNIRLCQYGMSGNKEPFVDIPPEIIRDALVELLDTRNHPILVHCNKGTVRMETICLPCSQMNL